MTSYTLQFSQYENLTMMIMIETWNNYRSIDVIKCPLYIKIHVIYKGL